MNKVVIENLCADDTVPFPATDAEVAAYALDDLGMLDADTLIDGKSAKDLAKRFYDKRDRFRGNTRLGQLLVNEFGVMVEQLVNALQYHELHGEPMGACFIKLNICTRDQINEALTKQLALRKSLAPR